MGLIHNRLSLYQSPKETKQHKGKQMPNEKMRCIKINDWIFEVKVVRALRVSNFGQPYSAIANVAFNGDDAIVDGILLKDEDTLTNNDYQTLRAFCLKMDMKNIKIEQNQHYSESSTLNYSKIASNS